MHYYFSEKIFLTVFNAWLCEKEKKLKSETLEKNSNKKLIFKSPRGQPMCNM